MPIVKAQWSTRAISGATFALYVTPNARQNDLTDGPDGTIKASTTTTPEDGKATAAVIELLAQALGVAKSRLTLIRGAATRHKLFRLD